MAPLTAPAVPKQPESRSRPMLYTLIHWLHGRGAVPHDARQARMAYTQSLGLWVVLVVLTVLMFSYAGHPSVRNLALSVLAFMTGLQSGTVLMRLGEKRASEKKGP